MPSEKYAVAMMRRRGAGGRRISTWASPFEWARWHGHTKMSKTYHILLGVAIKKKKVTFVVLHFLQVQFSDE
jgi:hypothetical protein